MSANLIAFDTQYVSEQAKNIERVQKIMEEAISMLRSASAHQGWKCPETRSINDSMRSITSKLTKLNSGVGGTAQALNKGLSRFSELETRAETQTNKLSNVMQNQHGFTASDRTTHSDIVLPTTIIPVIAGVVPTVAKVTELFKKIFTVLSNKFPSLFGGSEETPTPTSAPAPTPIPSPTSATVTESTTATTSNLGNEVHPGNFDSAMQIVFGNEGGYSNDPNDPGGATNMGITHYTLDNAYQKGIVSHNDVTRLTINEAKEIYREMYWEPSNAGKMPDPLATIYFDTVVLCGQYGGGRLLQRALNNLGQPVTVDGYVGPQTIAAINEQLKTPEDVSALCSELCDVRQAYHNADVNAKYYLAGWTNRVNRLRDLV